MSNRIYHPYHIVNVSPWPILMSIVLLGFGLVVVSWLTSSLSINYLIYILITIIYIGYLWFRDIIRESQGGYHPLIIQRGIIISFILFLITEI